MIPSTERPRVAVAMSGGVDSSVAAALLVEQGHDVVGFTMNIWPDQLAEPGDRNCCSPRSIDDARKVCAIIGVPHFVLNFKDVFARAVVDNFAESYFRGVTPNPCIDCNQFIKFGALEAKARAVGAESLATGHYARVDDGGAGPRRRLLRGADRSKDQSYVLYVLTQAQLAKAVFPLGELTKDRVRAKAAELGLPVADKPESMDICFVAADYRTFARQWTGRTGQAGAILDATGRRIGTHAGLENYTVGQRKGLGVATAEPAYVASIDSERNAIIVGARSSLLRPEFHVAQVNMVSIDSVAPGMPATVKVRSGMPELPCKLFPLGGDRIRVAMEDPAWGVAPGQAAVFYDGELVLAGGRIARDETAPCN